MATLSVDQGLTAYENLGHYYLLLVLPYEYTLYLEKMIFPISI